VPEQCQPRAWHWSAWRTAAAVAGRVARRNYNRPALSRLSRFATTALVLALLGGTAVALGVIEGFKLEKNPISGPFVDYSFSPVCGCPQRVGHISFRLRNTGTLTLEVIAADGHIVRTLVNARRFRHNPLHFEWNGRSDAGKLLPDGLYRFRLHFGGQHRTIVLPRGTRLDTKPPRVTLLAVEPRVLSPDGDHIRDAASVHYRVSEQAHVRVLVDGHVAVRGATIRLQAALYWPGTLGGVALPAGIHRISLVAQDLAGNLSRPSRSLRVQIRYVTFASKIVRARLGSRFTVRVLTDARVVHWRFLGKTGTSRPRRLVLRATRLGSHPLVAEANGHSARMVVLVVKR
jgi:hypothetical protein